jgi:hypothetical protein
MTPSGIKPATFQLVAQCTKCCVDVVWFRNSGSEILRYVIGWVVIDVSKERDTSIFRIKQSEENGPLSPWRCGNRISSKRRETLTQRHSVAFQKMRMLSHTAVITSNAGVLLFFFFLLRNDVFNWKVTGKNSKATAVSCYVRYILHRQTSHEKFFQHILHVSIPSLASYLPCQRRHSHHSLSACQVYKQNRHVSVSCHHVRSVRISSPLA